MEKLIISTSPHIHTKVTTQSIMRDVLISLAPAAIASVVLFGWIAVMMIGICVGCCVGAEALFNLIVKKRQTVSDLSAAVTGTILALSLSVPDFNLYSIWQLIWACVVGSVFAIVVVKCLFGGLGCNFANPAVTGRVVLLIAFAGVVGSATGTVFTQTDLVGGATPLAAVAAGGEELPSLLDMFLGNRGGAIGETCILAILLGFIYLVARRVINWYTPVVFVGTVAVFSLIYYLATQQDLSLVLYQVMGGGLVYGAVFMATDYVTTPINKWGKVVFAFGCGIITCLIRFFGTYPEGVSFSILFMNILSPYIEKWCQARPFGGVKNEK